MYGNGSAISLPVVDAGFGHLFLEAAFFDEVVFEALDLLIEEVVGLMGEAEGDVCGDLGGAGFDDFAVGLEGFFFSGGAAEVSDVEGFFRVFVLDFVVADAEVVAVIF